MCHHTVEVWTVCGCRIDRFEKCPHASRFNYPPTKCPDLERDPNSFRAERCMACVVKETLAASKAMEKHRLEARDAQEKAMEDFQATLPKRSLEPQGFLDVKGKGIDREEHPNYHSLNATPEEEEDDGETIRSSQPPTPGASADKRAPTHASQQSPADSSPLSPHTEKAPRLNLGRRISEKVKGLVRKFSKKSEK